MDYKEMSNADLKKITDEINKVKGGRTEKVNAELEKFFSKVKVEFKNSIASKGKDFLDTFGVDRKSLTIGSDNINGTKVILSLTMERAKKE